MDNVFLTGCDRNTEWMLEWWFENYSRHNDLPVIFADFGVSSSCRQYVKEHFADIITFRPYEYKAWFLKPKAMIEASHRAKKVCWIDTDCHVLDNISDIFGYSKPEKLGMVQDKPWSKRRGEVWHNSGVVLIEGTPKILHNWAEQIEKRPKVGDQEVLHEMVRGDDLKRMIHIEDLPNMYNWLRIQIQHDNHDSKKKKIMHWTGNKGKKIIKEIMKSG